MVARGPPIPSAAPTTSGRKRLGKPSIVAACPRREPPRGARSKKASKAGVPAPAEPSTRAAPETTSAGSAACCRAALAACRASAAVRVYAPCDTKGGFEPAPGSGASAAMSTRQPVVSKARILANPRCPRINARNNVSGAAPNDVMTPIPVTAIVSFASTSTVVRRSARGPTRPARCRSGDARIARRRLAGPGSGGVQHRAGSLGPMQRPRRPREPQANLRSRGRN
jgi:hypothetical protein